MSRSYAILGTGAVGGFYGARLQRAGLDVHFLAHRDYDHIAQYGLKVLSPAGDFGLPTVQVYVDAAALPACDVAVVALKTTDNHRLPALLQSCLKPDGVLLVLQNGLGGEAAAARIVGPNRVLGGMPFVCANKTGPGFIEHIDYGFMTLGAYDEDYTARGVTGTMEAIAGDLQRADIEIQLVEDLYLARWRKLVWNIPFNGLSVILDARTDEMMSHPATCALARQLMGEVLQGARACGREIPESYIEEMLTHTAQMKPYRTSMKIDFDRRRPLEVEAIYANPLNAAEARGTGLPRISVLYRQLQFLDERNTRSL